MTWYQGGWSTGRGGVTKFFIVSRVFIFFCLHTNTEVFQVFSSCTFLSSSLIKYSCPRTCNEFYTRCLDICEYVTNKWIQFDVQVPWNQAVWCDSLSSWPGTDGADHMTAALQNMLILLTDAITRSAGMSSCDLPAAATTGKPQTTNTEVPTHPCVLHTQTSWGTRKVNKLHVTSRRALRLVDDMLSCTHTWNCTELIFSFCGTWYSWTQTVSMTCAHTHFTASSVANIGLSLHDTIFI